MSNLDVSLRLRLVSQLAGPAKEAKRELEGIGTAAKKLDGSKAGKLAADLAKTKAEAKGAETALQKTAAGAKKLESTKADKLARDLAKARTEATAGMRALAQFNSQLQKLDGGHVDRMVRGLRNATAQSERLARGMRRVRDESRTAGHGGSGGDQGIARRSAAGEGGGALPGIIAGGARMLGAVGAGYMAYRTAANSVRTVVDQDKAWAEVRKKVNGATPDDLGKLEKQLRATARRYGLSISEVFEQAAEAGAAGIDKSDLVKFVELTTKASVGWDTTARETAQRIAEIKAATEMTLPQIDDLANKINALGDNSAAKEADIVEMFHRSGAAARAAGVQYDDTLAILTAIRSTGMQPEVASRWFNAFTFDMAGANAKGGKTKAAWKRLGFDPKDLANGMKTDAAGTIMKVFEAINKLEQTKKIEVLSAIFGQGWQDETARAAQAIGEIKKQLDFVRNPTNWQGSLQSNLDIQLSTTANHWERIKTTAADAVNEINRATAATRAFNAVSDVILGGYEKVLDGADKKPTHNNPFVQATTRLGRDGLTPDYDPVREGGAPPLRGPMTPLPLARNYSPVPSSAVSETTATMQRINEAISSEGVRAVATSQSIADRIRGIFNFTVTPNISPRIGGAPGVAPSGPASPAPAAKPVGKGASLQHGGVRVGAIHVHGAGKNGRQIGADIARQLAKLGDSSSALFDTV